MAIAEAINEFCLTDEAKGFIVHPKGEKPKKTSKPPEESTNTSAKKRSSGSANNRSSTAKKKTFSDKINDFVNEYKAIEQGQDLDIEDISNQCFGYENEAEDAVEGTWQKLVEIKEIKDAFQFTQITVRKCKNIQTPPYRTDVLTTFENNIEDWNLNRIIEQKKVAIDTDIDDCGDKKKEKKNATVHEEFEIKEYLCVVTRIEPNKAITWNNEIFSQKYNVDNKFNLYLFAVVVKTKIGGTGHYVVLLNCSNGWVKVDDTSIVTIDTKKYEFQRQDLPYLLFFRSETKQMKSKEAVRGIMNLGQSCYINAVMQVVAHMSELFVGPVLRREETVKREVADL